MRSDPSFVREIHAMDGLQTFTDAAKAMSVSPIAIVKLLIVSICGIAAPVMMLIGSFKTTERLPLIYCMLLFPFAVLGVFGWLVSQHANNLYAPGSFKDEKNYVRMQTALLLAAAAAKEPNRATEKLNVNSIINLAFQSAPTQTILEKSTLWVDDTPKNNSYEREAFEKTGFKISRAMSTQEAMSQLKQASFSAIISDMRRKEGATEGLQFLKLIRENSISTPFFTYSAGDSAEREKEVEAAGGQGPTSSPLDLYRLVTSAAS